MHRMHGHGVYTSPDGVLWDGEFSNGKFVEGKGAYVDLRLDSKLPATIRGI